MVRTYSRAVVGAAVRATQRTLDTILSDSLVSLVEVDCVVSLNDQSEEGAGVYKGSGGGAAAPQEFRSAVAAAAYGGKLAEDDGGAGEWNEAFAFRVRGNLAAGREGSYEYLGVELSDRRFFGGDAPLGAARLAVRDLAHCDDRGSEGVCGMGQVK